MSNLPTGAPLTPPGRNAYQVLDQVRKNCWKYGWVIDLDIKSFFDDIDHDKLLKALDKHVSESWVKLYIRRWLQSPMETRQGALIKRTQGTPQGGDQPTISQFVPSLYTRRMDKADKSISARHKIKQSRPYGL